jgi:hypothetical protein
MARQKPSDIRGFLSCPFCKARNRPCLEIDDLYLIGEKHYRYACARCGAKGGPAFTPTRAKAKWNENSGQLRKGAFSCKRS